MSVALRRLLTRAAVGAVLLGAVVLAAGAPPAWAHALLRTSVPAANASVPTSPNQIVLTFTEPPDPTFSVVEVVDSAGRPASGVGAARAVPGQSEQLVVPIKKPLPKGVYTVNWRSVSETDGHVAYGAFAFGVGAAAGPGSVVRVSLLNSSPWLSWAAATGRWLLYIGLALLVGAASTLLLVFGAQLPHGGLRLLRAAVAIAALGVIVMIETERKVVGVRSLLPLFVTREGLFLLALATAVVLCALAVGAVDIWPGRRWSLLTVGATATLAVLVHVLGGHAAAPTALQPLNVLDQWVHMTAVGVWTGGLAWLLLGIRGKGRGERVAAVRTFSRIATVTLVVVLASGVLRTLADVQPLSNLFHTSFGVALVVKVALVGVLVLFSALNHYRFLPALESGESEDTGVARAGGGAASRFALNSGAELAIVLAVLAVTAVLSGLAPANVALAGGARQTVVSGSDYATTVRVKLTVSPGTLGANDYTVAVDDYDTGKPLGEVASVSLGFSMPARPSVNSSTLSLRRASVGVWQGSGLELSIVGSWSVTVLIQQPSGGVDVPLILQVAN